LLWHRGRVPSIIGLPVMQPPLWRWFERWVVSDDVVDATACLGAYLVPSCVNPSALLSVVWARRSRTFHDDIGAGLDIPRGASL